ncbi:MAG: NRDE family protein [Ferruginibacter sp.]
MCTVTFIPVGDKYYITSNRDEKKSRSQAIAPCIHMVNGNKVIYPQDPDAGGSWIALNANGSAAVLLNGAFEKHESTPPYKKSRGVIFLAIISTANPVRYFMHMDLSGIEPFTMIIMDNCLYECRWNGTTKYCRQLKKCHHHIWSSATLYDETTVKKREQWFATFLNKNPRPTQEDILEFHQFGGVGDVQNDLKMNRNNKMSTVSITSIALDQYKSNMKYFDLAEDKIYQSRMEMAIQGEYAEIF